jgi:hypothetical protein
MRYCLVTKEMVSVTGETDETLFYFGIFFYYFYYKEGF